MQLTRFHVLWGRVFLPIARFHCGVKDDTADVEVEPHANCVRGHEDVEAGVRFVEETGLLGAGLGRELRKRRAEERRKRRRVRMGGHHTPHVTR